MSLWERVTVVAGFKYHGIVPRPLEVEAMKMNLFAERVFCHEVYVHLSFLNKKKRKRKKKRGVGWG